MPMNISQTSLYVFVKKPEPGFVKTRLGKAIGLENAAKLYQGMVELCIKRFQLIESANCTVYFDPPEEARFFQDWLGQEIGYFPQCNGGLGERLIYGFSEMLKNHQAAIALGSDSPDLPIKYLEQVICELANYEVVIGPAIDGGYYCIGMKEEHPELFEEIDWSTNLVLDQTLCRCKSLGLSVFVGPEWSDIDVKSDLKRLNQSNDGGVKRFIQDYAEILNKIVW